MSKIADITSALGNHDYVMMWGENFLDPTLKIQRTNYISKSVDAKTLINKYIENGGTVDATGVTTSASGVSDLKVESDQLLSFRFESFKTTQSSVCVISAQSSKGVSYIPLNSPEIDWIEDSPVLEQNKTYKIFGRNLKQVNLSNKNNPQCFLYNKATKVLYECQVLGSEDDKQGHYQEEIKVYNRILINNTIPAGNYDLYWYVGDGGRFGITKHENIQVVLPKKLATTEFKAEEFGILANLDINQSEAFQNAIIKLNAHAINNNLDYCILKLNVGTYRFQNLTAILPRVKVKGAGKFVTTIESMPNFVKQLLFTEPQHISVQSVFKPSSWNEKCGMIRLCEDSGIEKLSILSDENCSSIFGIWKISKPHAENITISNLNLENNAENGHAILAMTSSQNVIFEKCNIVSTVCIGGHISGPLPYSSYQKRRWKISRNNFKAPNSRWGTSAFGRAFGIECIIEYNVIEQSQRGMNAQFNDGKKTRNFFFRNEFRFNGQNRSGSESLLTEETSEFFSGKVTNSNVNWIELPVPLIDGEQVDRFVYISYGKGYGQIRRIISNDKTKVYFDKPLRIELDSTSVVGIGDFFARNIICAWNISLSKGGVDFFARTYDNYIVNCDLMFSGTGMWQWGVTRTYDGKTFYYNPCIKNTYSGNRLWNSQSWMHAIREKGTGGHVSPLIWGSKFFKCEFINSPIVMYTEVQDEGVNGTPLIEGITYAQCRFDINNILQICDKFPNYTLINMSPLVKAVRFNTTISPIVADQITLGNKNIPIEIYTINEKVLYY